MILEVHSNLHGTQQVLIDDEDYALIRGLGLHVWSTPRHHTLYAIVTFSGNNQIRLHRVIMGAKPEEVVDHINGNGLDNRRCNLRLTTQLNNNANARKRANATSVYKGVSFYRRTKAKPWKAQIQREGKNRHLGYFATEIEAARAYDEAAKKYFGEFAVLNFTEVK